MLVLQRKAGERIVIGNDISIEVVEILPGKVRLGLKAPTDVPVWREEVWIRMQEEGEHDPNATHTG